MTIYKYCLTIEADQTVHIPKNGIPLSVQNQDGNLTLWVMVDPNEETAPWRFLVAATGQELPTDIADFVHLGTTRIGSYVLHTFLRLDNE